jgi:pimeloyl-ACP methyl ester carboxylesterase
MKKLLLTLLALLTAAAGGAAWKFSPGFASLPLEELERRHATPDSKFADVDGVRVHYMDQGSGPAVVLLHASFMHLRTWDSLAKALSPRFRVIRLDLLNAGLTGPEPNGNYRMDRNVELTEGLLAQLGIDRYAIVATSSGGIVGFRLAAKQPDKVTRLVLINSAGMPRTAATNPNRPRGNALTRWIAANYVSPDMLRAQLQQNFVLPNTPPEWLVQMNYDLNRRAGRQEAGALQMKQFETGDPEATLAQVRAPTLVLWGLENATVMHLEADVFQHWLVNAPTFKKKYPGLGHYAYLEDPPTVEADMLAFLGGELDGELRVVTRSAWTPPVEAAAMPTGVAPPAATGK